MTSLPLPDRRLDLLFLRYWENSLSDAEAVELDGRLKADPAARAWFRQLSHQAAQANEWASLRTPTDAEPIPAIATPSLARGPNRRRMLASLAAGLLAGVVGGFAVLRAVRGSPTDESAGLRVHSRRGQLVLVGSGRPVSPGDLIPDGELVATLGPNSTALVEAPDGSSLTLTGDTSVMTTHHGTRLAVLHGAATADLRPPVDDAVPALIVSSYFASLVSPVGAFVAVAATATGSEIRVHDGRVQVTHTNGTSAGTVRDGECLLIGPNGEASKQAARVPPTLFAWDLRKPLPEGWMVGKRVEQADGPAVAPEFWFDPYHQAVLSQIRSDKHWTRGLALVLPDSKIRVRYRADVAGSGQVILVVRAERSIRGGGGVLEWNGAFEACATGEWKTIDVRADEMLDCREAPEYGPPWVAFQVLFNTYAADIGLRVAEFRVSRPGDSGPV